MPKAEWQPEWIPLMIDPEFPVFIFLPVATLLVLLALLFACDAWPENIRRPMDRHTRPRFLRRAGRNLMEFRVGKEHLQKSNEKKFDPLQVEYHSDRYHIYAHVLHTAPYNVWKSVVLSGLFSFAISWSLVNSIHFKYITLSTAWRIMESCQVLLETALPVASCSLTFYVCFGMYRFYATVGHVYKIQSVLEEIAFIAATGLVKSSEDDDVMLALWQLSHNLNLVHQLLYLQISSRFNQHSLSDLCSAGLCTEQEKGYLRRSEKKIELATFWLSNTAARLFDNEILDSHFVSRSMSCLAELRSSIASMLREREDVPPLTFMQIAQFAADALCLLAPATIIFKLLLGRNDVGVIGSQRLETSAIPAVAATDERAMEMLFYYNRGIIYMVPSFGAMVVTLAYQSVLQVVKQIHDPWGMGPDHLNPDGILNSTEKKINAHLTNTSDCHWRLRLADVFPAPKVATDEDQADEQVFSLRDIDPDVLSLAGKESVRSVTSSVAALAAPRADGRPHLPTAVVLSEENMKTIATGTVEDSRDLKDGVRERIHHVEQAKIQKARDDAYWIPAVQEMLPKLSEVQRINDKLREQLAILAQGAEPKEAEDEFDPHHAVPPPSREDSFKAVVAKTQKNSKKQRSSNM